MNLSSNKYYIILNLLGWVVFVLATLGSGKLYLIDEALSQEATTYYWLETIGCALLAFLLSFVMSTYIDKNIDVKEHWKSYALKIFIVFVITQILYNIMVWPMLELFKDFAEYKRDQKVSLNTKLYNVFYFALLFIIWLFIILTTKIYYQLKRVQLKQLQTEANLKDAQLNTLKGQINPHFMFNSLNNIRGLMLEDVGKARNVITNLSETLRYSLTKSEENSIALEDELEMIEGFVEIAKIQYEDRLEFEMNIDEDTLNHQIPPMIIQMLVENALKHGIANLKDGGTVGLTTSKIENELQIEVVNSGSIQQQKESTQIGVQNIKKRLELLYGNKATFNLTEKDNQVFATIKIPLS